jgi:DNA polymerase III delta prime subunit
MVDTVRKKKLPVRFYVLGQVFGRVNRHYVEVFDRGSDLSLPAFILRNGIDAALLPSAAPDPIGQKAKVLMEMELPIISTESDGGSDLIERYEKGMILRTNKGEEAIHELIAFAKMQSQRKKVGLPAGGNAPHMAFLGNPGSAKTTVARLLARILSDEQILQGDIFVECGRQDLVGKYVGWTAKQVEAKFKEAKGGILFIDEAYALTDGRDGSFGDEAINTIVQQMENHRDDTIVIFAGYPDKMIKFLKKNEGLRSRIGFQLTFEDYTPNQLDEIMQKMAEDKCYELDEDAKAACHEVFCNAVRMKDFGNGRYVRNLLQKAIMNQANRIYAEAANGEAGKDDLMLLRAEDFRDIQETFWEYDHSNPIGFSV